MCDTPSADVHSYEPRAGDALVLVDVQNDFLPGGALAVPGANEVIAPLNRSIGEFERHRLPVFATRDWHPGNHCSFRAQGGPWPPHCIAGSQGAQFAAQLQLLPDVHVISKATRADIDAYSGFQGTDLAQQLRDLACTRTLLMPQCPVAEARIQRTIP
jgi:nicotinamidase/pyrazinamidase